MFCLIIVIVFLSAFLLGINRAKKITHLSYIKDQELQTPPGLDVVLFRLHSNSGANSSSPVGVCHWCMGRRAAGVRHRVDKRHRWGNESFAPEWLHILSQTPSGWSYPASHHAAGRRQSYKSEAKKNKKPFNIAAKIQMLTELPQNKSMSEQLASVQGCRSGEATMLSMR